ncbi:Circumsporozoite protein precursor, putative [Pediculus humanus corporis]|uniref:Circumsporozoite protein, putative n=1 Tax=Pediculus humanus subsp. corporis TaxID=121224 RepID=E0VS47_PEDHC|nr:Circumsporozoite protein precursor, putative [Pediculus humanus corporis]EEB16203.1 Circumsporozoite protein precursor, putative [Pediculus humanus corporis]
MDGDEAAKGNENKQGPNNQPKVTGAPSSSNTRASSFPNVAPLMDPNVSSINNPNVLPLIDADVVPSNHPSLLPINDPIGQRPSNPKTIPLIGPDVPPSTSNVKVPSSSNIKVPSSSNIKVPSSSNIKVPSSTNIKVPSSTNVNVPSNANLKIPSSTNVKVPSASNVKVPSAANINVPSGTNVKVPSASNIKAPSNQNLGAPSTSNVSTSKDVAESASKKEDLATKHSSLASKYLEAFTKNAAMKKRPEGKRESVFDFNEKEKKLIPEKTTSEGNTASYLNLLNMDNETSERKTSKSSRKKYTPFDLSPVDAARNVQVNQNANNTTGTAFVNSGQTNCPGLAATLLQKRSPFIHDPPELEERRPRIQSPRTPREYIINLREDLADFQESHGLPRSRDYSFVSLGLALIQETGRALFSLFQMFTELFPVLAIISLILRFALDKLIEIFETQETVPKIKKAVIFTLEMIAIILPLWIIVGSILVPLLSLVLSLFKRVFHIRWRRHGCSAKR